MESGIFSFFKQSSVYVIGGVLQRCIGFLLLPLYTAFLTPEDYGIIGLISVSISLLVPVGVLGVSTSLMIEYYHSDTEEEKKNTISAAIVISSISSLIISGILFLCSRSISILLFSTSQWTYAVQLASISFFFSCVNSVGLSFLRTRQQPVKFISVSVCSLIASAVLNILFIAYLHHGLVGFYEAAVIVGLFQSFVLFFWVIRYAMPLRVYKRTLFSLVELGAPDIPIRIAGWVLSSANRYFIVMLASLSEAGIFSLAFRFASIMELLFISIMRFAFTPYLLARMKDDNFSIIHRRLICYIMIIGVFLAVSLGTLSKDLIFLMARNEGFWPAYKPVAPLVLAFLFYGFYFTYRPILGIIKKPKLAIPGLIAAAIVNCILNYLFVPLWGAVGAAVAFATAYLVATIQIHFSTMRYFKLSMPWKTLIRILLAGALCYSFVVLIPGEPSFLMLFIKGFAILIIYPLTILILGAIDDTEKKAILKKVKNLKFIKK